ncbi:ammonium transporter [Demetria terragena]|uniref:ammonium transporter n=1 Tax=Demetria terragena TaxID=63959 RepID=UPI0003A93C26|nr:ammonium transporter [Demetria terragena]
MRQIALVTADPPVLDTGTTAWMLISASLVLLMTPALALFYGGMNRSKSVLNMLMMSFVAVGVVGVVYVLWGYSMSFSDNDLGGFISNPFTNFGLKDLITDASGATVLMDTGIPAIVFVGFQLTFAILTVALISGSLSDRVRFGTWLVFSAIWVTLVYFPLAHMVWGGGLLSPDGWFGGGSGDDAYGPIDFAGGTVVHINAGMAALVLAVLAGRRVGFGKVPMRPHNVPLTMLGAGLLWFGWFGFNAGSALAADGTAGLVWVNTTAATCAALLGWLLVERIRDGRPTSIGAASGVVAGLVAITPACAALTPIGSLVLGGVAGVLSALAVGLKYRFGYDDSLDVVGVHLVAGLWGTIAIGLLGADTGLFYGHGLRQLGIQTAVAAIALAYTGVLTLAIGTALKATMGWRIDEDDEVAGIDQAQHAESAYEMSTFAGGRIPRRPIAGDRAVTRDDEEVSV